MYNGVRFFRCLLLAALFSWHGGVAKAHDIPADAIVSVFVKPEGPRLQLLVRVPLRTIRDVDFPLRERGYLDLEKVAPLLPNAAVLWLGNLIEIYEGETRLPAPQVVATQISVASDRSFGSFDDALRHVTGQRLSSENVVADQALFDVLMEYRIRSDQSSFSIRPGLQHLAARTLTVLRFLPPGGAIRAYEFPGDPGVFPLDPRWQQAALRFVQLGFLHILEGTDHLLFLLCLVIPFRQVRPLVWVVTAFTVAHSVTLFASAFQFAPDALWFPPFIETLIAASIVYMALENIVGAGTLRRRWMYALGFGLVHGFGFSFALRETMQFAGSHLLASLVAFNAGVELGQLLALALLIPLLNLLFRFVVAERIGTIVLSALVAHTGWHWTEERFGQLRRFTFEWPDVTTTLLAGMVRWLLVLWIIAGVLWFIQLRRRRFMEASGVLKRDPKGFASEPGQTG